MDTPKTAFMFSGIWVLMTLIKSSKSSASMRVQCKACSFNSGAMRKYSGVSCEISFCPWSRYIPKTTLCLNANGHGLYGTIEAIQIKTDVKVYSREMIKGNKFNIQYIFDIFPIRQRLDTKLYVWNDICAPGFFNTFSCNFRNRINSE